MKILITSDSHGKKDLLQQIIEREKPDHTIHCGDFCTDLIELPDVPLTVVRGNCDWERVPEEDTYEVDGLRFYVTHGHLFRVSQSGLPLKYRAEEKDAQIVCFGHSHYPVCDQVDERLYINPGSIKQARGFAYPTYSVLSIGTDQQIQVTYHQVDGTQINERGGTYQLKK
ncbi:putative phosphoesterase [Croceifilum oryzae]|uniref:Phosphoesterase n=1 Tax=Croceifilum oryzae TaxID=1553429 RepID=A0AAJ1WTQ4_9BACL|nr:metallophosphoesterase [Croceifilum oryzae]MDQ0417236.1 putative phosphoesterase [Croceifilum oryzae]